MSTPGQHITPNVWCLYELFSWDPRQLYSDVYNILEVVMSKILSGVENYMLQADLKLHRRYHAEFKRGIVQFREFLNKRVDQAFSEFEYATNRDVLDVPRELIDKGWLRTAAQINVDFTKPKEAVDLMRRVLDAEKELNGRLRELREMELQLQELVAKRDYHKKIVAEMPQLNKHVLESLEALDQKSLEVPAVKRARTELQESNDWIEANYVAPELTERTPASSLR